jgi:hypothetical protein
MDHPQVVHPKQLLKDKGKTFDSKMVSVMANILGSVGFIWFCIILDAVGFAGLIYQTTESVHSHTNLLLIAILWVTFIAQAVIQLIALPVLQNYQNRQNAADEAKADVDHKTFTYLATLQDQQMQELKNQTAILEELRKKKKNG